MLGKKPEKLLYHQGKDITPIMRKLNAFTEKVLRDIEKEKISKADGQRLIVRATITVSMLTKK